LNIDWSRTRAYGFGINGIYVNLRGREKNGIVAPSDRRALLEDISHQLVKVVDPETAEKAVNKCYIKEDAFHDTGELEIGPDIVVGYAKGTRCSNSSARGAVPLETFTNNYDAWAADHCMDPETVPGVLFSNRPLRKAAPNLQSLGAAILAEFGVEDFAGSVETLQSVGYISADR
ncbi:MAG: nucleotide pyrophosphatase, partial [bacterium]|nr:nucleotide pyrophosphatase [bacterium]